ncbi:TetR/AcrR family transcriptional regulator [Gordonia amicalis]|uniref:TetR/AcrR family transcriptional regulator n=1 Tax=Gordonia amicalis TaxID=89053 RepID=UPI0002A62AC4|nr:TetR/AcrR family transcriptional regulator [Gordonia amicalis]MDV7100919.1 TetR/AcrR family transcriptional regulator [Gordonia amicalis]MDV7174390.1 TetR/AcrR family transcriptional regulator [Gordonia amicalis]NKX78043.1 TetR/AcrR family transcriptional regulator [Gordonia amicalis]GAC52847.1 putative transcriptional regulator [Gordonia amicalis NBRC 100051 = JCM 11271]
MTHSRSADQPGAPRPGGHRLSSHRLGATDWVDAALELLTSTGGPRGVTIARLCETLGVTKGSFYWHFTDLDGLWEAMAMRWKDMNRQRVIELNSLAEMTPDARLTALSTMLVSSDHLTVERAIRDRARTNERIAETVRDIDSEIFAAAEATLTELGMGPGQTRMLASLLVYAGIGYIHGHDGLPAISPDDVQHALAALLS